jgi:hypothetical protein
MLFKQITHDETWAVLSGDSLFVGDAARAAAAQQLRLRLQARLTRRLRGEIVFRRG